MSSKIKFVTIGYIEWRKGQDLLFDAIESMSDEVKEQALFTVIGQNTSLMAQNLAKKIKSMPYISMPGTVSREEIHNILEQANVMICPSREDPMPTVCAEAMMHKVPCIVSDATGTAAYIKDGFDGLIFKSEDVDELRSKIIWCIDNHDILPEMGDGAFGIYQRIFSMESFEKNLLKYVHEII